MRSLEEITSSVKKDGKNLESPGLASVNSLRSPNPKEKCTWSQMNEFKDALLFYYCHKFVEPNCPLEVKSGDILLDLLNKVGWLKPSLYQSSFSFDIS